MRHGSGSSLGAVQQQVRGRQLREWGLFALYVTTLGIWFLPGLPGDSSLHNPVDTAAQAAFCALSLVTLVLAGVRFEARGGGRFAHDFVQNYWKDFYLTYLVVVGIGALLKPVGFFYAPSVIGVDLGRLLFSPVETNVSELVLITTFCVILMVITLRRFEVSRNGKRWITALTNAWHCREARGLFVFHFVLLCWIWPFGYRVSLLGELARTEFWLYVGLEMVLAAIGIALFRRRGHEHALGAYISEFPRVYLIALSVLIILAFALPMEWATLLAPDPVGRFLFARGRVGRVDLVAIGLLAALRICAATFVYRRPRVREEPALEAIPARRSLWSSRNP